MLYDAHSKSSIARWATRKAVETMEPKPVIGVRVEPDFRAAIKGVAEQYHDGSESGLLREAARVYLAMRRKYGVQYEPTLALLGIDASRVTDQAA